MRQCRGLARAGRNQRGVTIPELMTGMTTFAVVAAAVTSVLIGTLSSVGFQATLADAQLDVASAMALVQDDLRTLGYITDTMNQNIVQQLVSGTSGDSIQFVGDVNADNVSE